LHPEATKGSTPFAHGGKHQAQWLSPLAAGDCITTGGKNEDGRGKSLQLGRLHRKPQQSIK